ncbi:MAG: MFS transporter [Pseudobutyrivibrio sp.]|nr:MFS transporter [Pseudobutyrivibrio sp.]
MMGLINQYKGLRKENYILFLGRFVTSLGSMIWPVLTLILSQKLAMMATDVSLVIIFSGIIMLPATFIGGKLADKYNKKMIIVYCDIISIVFYIIAAFIPLSLFSIGLLMIAASCQNMESPAYTALIADITASKDREKAYSLSYLGANLGLVLSPTIAGLLFENHLWLSFLLSGAGIACSTVLIFFFVKDISLEEDAEIFEDQQGALSNKSLLSVLLENKVVLFYIIVLDLYWAAYSQYSYLLPLDIGRVHGEDGALIFGSVSSINCLVVVIFTPILTRLLFKLSYTVKNLLGICFSLLGYIVFVAFLGHVPIYYFAMTLFTFGEILTVIVGGAYMSERIPASHRGRVNGFYTILQNVLYGMSIYISGRIVDLKGSYQAWYFIFALQIIAIAGSFILIFVDKKAYPKLYDFLLTQ